MRARLVYFSEKRNHAERQTSMFDDARCLFTLAAARQSLWTHETQTQDGIESVFRASAKKNIS